MEIDEEIENKEVSLLIRSFWFSLVFCLLLATAVAGIEHSCNYGPKHVPSGPLWEAVAFTGPQYLVFLCWGLILILRRRGRPFSSYSWSLVGSWLTVSFGIIPYFISYWYETCRLVASQSGDSVLPMIFLGAIMSAFFSLLGSMAGYKIYDADMFADARMVPVLIVVTPFVVLLGYAALIPLLFLGLGP
jgi:hypothetical protein